MASLTLRSSSSMHGDLVLGRPAVVVVVAEVVAEVEARGDMGT